jgi:hypothetical protein
MSSSVDTKLIDEVDELRDQLKVRPSLSHRVSLDIDSLLSQAANTKLNKNIVETAFYKKVLAFALDEGLPDKKAASYALKMTLDFYKSSS